MRCAVPLSCLLLLAGCSDDPCDDGACTEPPHIVGAAPQGADVPPTLEELLDLQTPVWSRDLAVSGMSDVLADGDFILDVPPGALPVGTELTVMRYGVGGTPGDSVGDLYRIMSPTQPSSPVNVTMPLPDGWDGTSPEAYALWYHDGEFEPEVVMGDVDLAMGTLAVQLSRFSVGAAHVVPGVSPDEPVSRIVNAPMYAQFQTDNCWSVALTMLVNAYGAPMDPWDANALFEISTEHGLPFAQYMYADAIEQYIQAVKTDAEVERKVWVLGLEQEAFRSYLNKNMREGRPTMLHASGWLTPKERKEGNGTAGAHMLLFVGISGDTLVYHDPNGQGFELIEFEELMPLLETQWGLDQTGTLALMAPAPSSMATATMIIPDTQESNRDGISFFGRKDDGRFDQDNVRLFRWYLSESRTAGTARPDGTADVVTRDMVMFPKPFVTNNVHASGSRPMKVGLDVYDAFGELIHQRSASAGNSGSTSAGKVRSVPKLGAIELKDFIEEPGQYDFMFYAVDDGGVQDFARVPVEIGTPEWPYCPPVVHFHDGTTWILDPEEFRASGEAKPEARQSQCNPTEPSPVNDCFYGSKLTCRYVHPTIDDEFSMFVQIALGGHTVPGEPCEEGAGHLDRLDYSFGGPMCDTRPCTRASATHYIHVAGFITMGPNYFGDTPSKAYFDDLDQVAAKYIAQLEPIAQKCP